MASVAKIIYLISILVAIACIVVSIAISPAWSADPNNTFLKANGALSIVGLRLLTGNNDCYYCSFGFSLNMLYCRVGCLRSRSELAGMATVSYVHRGNMP
uniref:Uncharacterized protein n=1 Tax=Trichobilharzia regenti TaxID=157069 RepID=A0AA85IY74_TRIRE|nr:unnamed protein product [Trichobilharzia regenti]